MFKARRRPVDSAGSAESAESAESAGSDRGATAVQDTPPPAPAAQRTEPVDGEQPTRIASLVWLLAVICALFLAIGALLVALQANRHNSVVSFVLGGADKLDLGVFSRKDGIFTFHGKDAAIKDALVNWGIGAIVYLVVGKFADRVIRP